MILTQYSQEHPWLLANAPVPGSNTAELEHASQISIQSVRGSKRCLAPGEPPLSSPPVLNRNGAGQHNETPLRYVCPKSPAFRARSSQSSAFPSDSPVLPQRIPGTGHQPQDDALDTPEEALSDHERRAYEFRITKLQRDLRAEAANSELLRRQRDEVLAELGAYGSGKEVLVARTFRWEGVDDARVP